MKSVKVKIVL